MAIGLLILIGGALYAGYLALSPGLNQVTTNSALAVSSTFAVSPTVSASSTLSATTTSTLSATKIEFAGVLLTVEIATTPADQQKGLSNRDTMAMDHGMLFVFQQEGTWGFWMKDMRFSLDIIWFNAQRQVVFIEQNLSPCTPQNCPIFTPTANAMYVLEVNAGFVQAHNVSLGDTFGFAS